jgi:hypothetical protein
MVNYKRILQILSIIVFLSGLTILVMALNEKDTNSKSRMSPRFRAVFLQSYTPTGGARENQARIERLQKSDGSWKETTVTIAPDGSPVDEVVKYAINGRGLFVVNNSAKQLRYLSPRPDVVPAFEGESLRKSPTFNGEGETLGYRTLIERSNLGTEYIEMHHAVDLNGLVVKIVSVSEGGTTIIEATEIKIDGFTEKDFGEMPEYPVNYDGYKKAIDVTRESGKTESADQMEQNLPK